MKVLIDFKIIIWCVILAFSFSSFYVDFMSSTIGVNFAEPCIFVSVYYILSRYPQVQSDVITTIHSRLFVLWGTILVIWGTIGFLTGGDVVKVYSDFRCFVVFVFFLVLLKYATAPISDYIKLFFIYSVCQSGIDVAYMLYHLADMSRFSSIAVCPFFVTIVLLRCRKIKLAFVFELVLLLENVLATFKYNYIILILSFLYWIYYYFKVIKQGNLVSIVCVGVTFTLATIVLMPRISDFINSDGSRKLHSVLLTEKYIKEGDQTRKNTNMVIFEHPEYFYVPQGFGWQNHVKRIQRLTGRAVLSSMDSNLLYFVYHFGIVLGLFLIIFLFFYGLYILRLSLLNNAFEATLLLAFLLIVFMSLFILKSWIFVYLNYSFVYSYVLFLVSYQSHKYFEGLDSDFVI